MGAGRIIDACRRKMGMSLRVIVSAIHQSSKNQDSSAAAALSFYTVFSIVPLLFLAILSCGFFFGQETTTHKIEGWVNKAIGDEIGEKVANDLEELLDDIRDKITNTLRPDRFWTGAFWVLAFIIIVHVIGVLALFTQARAGLCVIWRIQNTHANAFLVVLFDYLLAVIMFSLILAILLGSLVIGKLLGESRFLGNLLSFLILALTLAVSYRVLSADKFAWRNVSYRIPWRYVWYGAAIVSLLFLLGKTFLQQYLVNLYHSDLYGRGGFLVVFLLWVYYCSQIFFFGAELIQARMTRGQELCSPGKEDT